MNQPIIEVKSLSKSYKLGSIGAGSLKADLENWWRGLRGGGSDAGAVAVNAFWALKDVSFEVWPGEVLGIIGRNGAGKSTLLKILSRITEPSRGEAILRGRVASLLEVGTGFHADLSGRENIYLNGAIMGMKQREISSKFDEIVAFAEVEKFIDTPVKHYSSGMYVRLAFAVAAHLEPEILIVDEVLAVGDAEFQKKCLGKMRSVSNSGRTILFVSHNTHAIRTLCNRVALIENGNLAFIGGCAEGLQAYADQRKHQHASKWRRKSGQAKTPVFFEKIESVLKGKQPDIKLCLHLEVTSFGQHKPAFIAADIMDASGLTLMQALPTIEGFISNEKEVHYLDFEISLPPMVPGIYYVTLWMGPHNLYTFDTVIEAVQFEINETPTVGRTIPHSPECGFMVPYSRVADVSQS